MKKITAGFAGGVIGAVINLAFLLPAPDLKTEVYLATGISWIVTGIFLSICNLKCNSLLKGIIIAFLVSASSLVYTVTSSLSGALWTVANTLIVGAVTGYIIDKMIQLWDKK